MDDITRTAVVPLRKEDARAWMRRIVEESLLEAHFQPIVSLRSRDLLGYEGLIRGPQNSPWRNPAALFAAARRAGLGLALELASARAVVAAFVALDLPGRIAVNFSGPSLERLGERSQQALGFLLESGLSPSRVVVELTEHERVADSLALKRRISALRAMGVCLALDDFGDGHSSLRLWAELSPEFVKIDKYFIAGLHADPLRFQCVKALRQLGEVFGTRLVAEGIEESADLRVARDLGIEFGQGFLLGAPRGDPPREPPAEVVSALADSELSVYPEVVKMPATVDTVGGLAFPAPTLGIGSTNNAAVELFASDARLHAIAVVDEGRPVGILNRRGFMDRYAQPYYRELFGKRSCTAFMGALPVQVESGAPLDTLMGILTGSDQRYLADGLVVVDQGRYVGIATGESVVRAIAEMRVEAARYANPLTFLPGNIPISEHVARLLAAGVPFGACYGDLNQFKPFNDQYGYWRGDEMIKLAARCITAHCDPLRDFVGHVGGDDFVVLFQSPDWLSRCERIVMEFNAAAPALFDAADRERGGITAEDRQGRPAFFPLTTLCIGAVRVEPGEYRAPEDVASAAAAAKRHAKQAALGVHEARALAAAR